MLVCQLCSQREVVKYCLFNVDISPRLKKTLATDSNLKYCN